MLLQNITLLLILIIFIFIFIFIIILIKHENMSTNCIDKFTNWNDIKNNVIYINLEKRVDRNKLILEELNKLDVDISKVVKVAGIYIPKNGHKGCVQSHILALNIAKMNKWKYALIFEDDMEPLLSPDNFSKMIDTGMDYMEQNNINWDIIMLGSAYSTKTPLPNTKIISRIKNATTSIGYIVQDTYYDKLLNLFNNCNENMMPDKWGGGKDWEPFALDQQWKKLQETDNWYSFTDDLIKARDISSTIMIEKMN